MASPPYSSSRPSSLRARYPLHTRTIFPSVFSSSPYSLLFCTLTIYHSLLPSVFSSHPCYHYIRAGLKLNVYDSIISVDIAPLRSALICTNTKSKVLTKQTYHEPVQLQATPSAPPHCTVHSKQTISQTVLHQPTTDKHKLRHPKQIKRERAEGIVEG